MLNNNWYNYCLSIVRNGINERHEMKKNIFGYAFIISFFFILQNYSFGTVLVSANFDNQSYSSPLEIAHIFGGSWAYDALNNHGINGYAIRGDHAEGDLIAMIDNLERYLEDGIYFRYWVKYSSEYYFPGELNQFENVKMLKFAGGDADIEFIYKKSADGGPHSLQLYWIKESTRSCCGGTGSSETDLFPGENTDFAGNKYLTKNIWHKIEIYIKVSDDGSADGNSMVHVQVDDSDVYINRDADFMLPASVYTSAQQFVSIHAHDSPPAGHGYWYLDDIIAVYNEGDLCDNEPDGQSDVESPSAPTGVNIMSIN
ncbi:MAG: hypothetical protein AB7T22_01345 [Calditrichaceae bacterium]